MKDMLSFVKNWENDAGCADKVVSSLSPSAFKCSILIGQKVYILSKLFRINIDVLVRIEILSIGTVNRGICLAVALCKQIFSVCQQNRELCSFSVITSIKRQRKAAEGRSIIQIAPVLRQHFVFVYFRKFSLILTLLSSQRGSHQLRQRNLISIHLQCTHLLLFTAYIIYILLFLFYISPICLYRYCIVNYFKSF